MNLSSADWIQLGTSVVFIVASIASILVFAVKVHMPNWALAIIGVACFGIVAFIFLRNPSISTLTIMGGVATAIGILVGGASWVVNHGSDKFVAVLVSVLALGLMVTIVFHFTQPAPGPLPIPTPNLPFTSSATATTIAPATTSTGTSASTGPNGSTNPPGKSPTPTPRGSGHGPTSTATPGSGPVVTATPGSGPTPTPTPTPQPTATPTPKPTPVFVQNASASNFSATPNGCFPTVQVSGTIFTNGGQGTISYYWGRSDGSSSASQTVGAVTGQSSYNVSDTWVPQVNSSPSTYWDELFVTGPNGVNSNQASGTLSC